MRTNRCRMVLRSALSILLFLLSVSLPAEAKESTVIFQTVPPGAQVSVREGSDYRPIGVSGTEIRLQLPANDEALSFRLDLAGYETRILSVNASNLRTESVKRYPDHPWELQPSNRIGAWLLRYGKATVAIVLLLAAVLVPVLVVFVLPRHRRSREAADRARAYDSKIIAAGGGDPWIGYRLGHYLLAERLGRGGMATVYRAVPMDTLDDTQSVAVKVISDETAKQPDFQNRFMREVGAGKELEHPGIIKNLDWGKEREVYYIVMELVAGETLRQKILPGGLPLDEAMQYLRPLFKAAHHAHEKGFVHRDIKPENVMVVGPGDVKIMDFGQARGKYYDTVTVTGFVFGTPGYVAPEMMGEGRMSDPRCDQYSLGVMAFELLSGRQPFDDEDDPMVLMFKHLSAPARRLREFRPDLPESLDEAVHRMLAKTPADRFPSVAAALEALEIGSHDVRS